MISSTPFIVIRYDRHRTPIGSKPPTVDEVGHVIAEALERLDPGIIIRSIVKRSEFDQHANLDGRPSSEQPWHGRVGDGRL